MVLSIIRNTLIIPLALIRLGEALWSSGSVAKAVAASTFLKRGKMMESIVMPSLNTILT